MVALVLTSRSGAKVPATSVALSRPQDLSTVSAVAGCRLAAVCTGASAVVHACAGPHHVAEHLLLGTAFLVCAWSQFVWAALLVLSPTRSLLWLGVALNTVLVAGWATSRIVTVPLLTLGGPHAVGAWDVAATLWEQGALACCVVLLLREKSTGTAGLAPEAGRLVVRCAAAVSAVALVGLALTGPPL